MEYFFIILLIVAGYFVFLSIAISHADNKRALPNIALSMLLVYGCSVGLLVAVGDYLGETGLLLYAIAILYAVSFLVWKIFDLIKARPKLHQGAFAAFLSYLLAVLYITSFMREAGSNHQIQMELLNWMREDGVENLAHTTQNVVMFVPIGLLFPFISDGKRGKLLSGVSFGILFSTAIETGQLLLRSGTCDIDDIFSNTFGALLGAVIGCAALRFLQKRRERVRNRQGKT